MSTDVVDSVDLRFFVRVGAILICEVPIFCECKLKQLRAIQK